MFYPAASKLVCKYLSHQVHRAIKIISTARKYSLKRKLISSKYKDTLQNIHKLRAIIKRKESHNISPKPECKLHWKRNSLQILMELHAV